MAELQIIIVAASSFLGALGGVATISWWLATKFNRVYERIANVKEVLSLKIDEHEKLDIARFAAQEIAIMKLELQRPTGLGVVAGGDRA